jgi:outer membrane PBP1 activator LpoA protein
VNQDLGGLQLLAMPWRLGQETLPGNDSDASSSFAALHALGADAYSLARRWWRMQSVAAPIYPGLTAELQRGPDGSLLRRLSMAEFDRGRLRPR